MQISRTLISETQDRGFDSCRSKLRPQRAIHPTCEDPASRRFTDEDSAHERQGPRPPANQISYACICAPFCLSSEYPGFSLRNPPPQQFRRPTHFLRPSLGGSDVPSARIAPADPFRMQFLLESKPPRPIKPRDKRVFLTTACRPHKCHSHERPPATRVSSRTPSTGQWNFGRWGFFAPHFATLRLSAPPYNWVTWRCVTKAPIRTPILHMLDAPGLQRQFPRLLRFRNGGDRTEATLLSPKVELQNTRTVSMGLWNGFCTCKRPTLPAPMVLDMTLSTMFVQQLGKIT